MRILAVIGLSAILAAGAGLSPSRAGADGAKYADWKGAWERYVPPVSVVSPSGMRTPGGQPSFDQTKPWGRGQEAPLTLESRLHADYLTNLNLSVLTAGRALSNSIDIPANYRRE